MHTLGFNKTLRGWVMQGVTTASYSISTNGCFHGYFQSERGLTQGDITSSFHIISEILL